jgi:O-antigen/teichoic acid export membrane protein
MKRTPGLTRDASLYFIGKAGAAAGVFAAIPLATRGVGAREFGEFALWSAVALWTSTATIGWVQSAVQRFHRERRLGDRFADYVASVRSALWWGGVGSGIVVATAAAHFSSLTVPAILAMGLLAVANAAYIGRQALAQADLAAGRVVLAEIARGLVLPVVLVCASVLGVMSVGGIALAHALGLLAAVAILSFRSPLPAIGRLRVAELRALWRYGFPVGLWLVTSLASTQIGRLVLELHALPDALAIYAAVHEVIIKAGTLVLMPVVYAAQAHVMAAWADNDMTRVRRSLRRAFMLQGTAGIFIVVGCSMGGDVLRRVLFVGAGGAQSTAVLAAMLAAGVVLGNLGLLAHKGLELGQRTHTMLALALMALLLNGGLCVLLVPELGALGAGVSYAVAQAVYAVSAHACSRGVLARLRA